MCSAFGSSSTDVSASVRTHPARERGFSLVEILMTLSIAALASVLIVATARPADPLRTEGEKLSHTIEQLETRARISGQPVGLVLEPTRYTAVVWRNGKWTRLSAKAHSLKAGVQLRITEPLRIEEGGDPTALPAPSLIFDPLGHSVRKPVVLEAQGREFSIERVTRGPAGNP